MKIIKTISSILMATSAICLLISSVTLINVLLVNSLPGYIFLETIIIVNSTIAGISSAILLKLINDTEEQQTKDANQVMLLKELESAQRVERDSYK
tara:strand:+ start:533 stop:820 length:288 start_codon:yes stop_codon:yes gene_type:complete